MCNEWLLGYLRESPTTMNSLYRLWRDTYSYDYERYVNQHSVELEMITVLGEQSLYF